MRLKTGFLSVLFLAAIITGPFFLSPAAQAVTSSYADNFTLPERQSGYAQEMYEAKGAQKLQRGFENLTMGYLEIPRGIRTQVKKRREDYLPVGPGTVTFGFFKGIGNMVKRMVVGVYEVATFRYAQPPVLEELTDWAY